MTGSLAEEERGRAPTGRPREEAFEDGGRGGETQLPAGKHQALPGPEKPGENLEQRLLQSRQKDQPAGAPLLDMQALERREAPGWRYRSPRKVAQMPWMKRVRAFGIPGGGGLHPGENTEA